MALSEYEQRALDEIERGLLADFPALNTALRPQRASARYPLVQAMTATMLIVCSGCLVLGLISASDVGIPLALVAATGLLGCWAIVRVRRRGGRGGCAPRRPRRYPPSK
jgi:hypothetical protein